MRSFWLNLQDAVEGTPLLVAPAKGGAKGECLRCYYIRRGSFKDLDAAELRTLIFKNPALKTKFRSLRRRHIKLTTRNPGSRPRHESVDVKHYTERKDESYCDIYQEGERMALTDYINTKITDEQIRKKLKTVAQKKAYVSNDDMGTEGVIIVASSSTKKVRMGSRVSASQIRQEEHENSAAAKSKQEKNKLNNQMQVNTKDGLLSLPTSLYLFTLSLDNFLCQVFC
ncbi:unnamed protein product [Durusdinium trenchii]|uniref:Uncharacterized protein n=1 Tax=Durusdinium trenchii TaxID=1381693 RepID=A0ABP0M3I5_9DINO